MTIPSWDKCHEKELKADELSPVEKFIHDWEPLIKFDARLWRADLLNLLNYKLKFCLDEQFINDQETRCGLEYPDCDDDQSVSDLYRHNSSQLDLVGLLPVDEDRQLELLTGDGGNPTTDGCSGGSQ